MAPTISPSELAQHNSPASLWLAIDNDVYDFTKFAPTHPGGLHIILQHAGGDATAAYNAVHSSSLVKSILPVSKHLGRLSSPLPPRPSPSTSPAQQPSKPALSTLISVNDFRLAAHTFLPPKTLAFISSAATDCHTHRRNSAIYSDITLRPRVLVDVSAPVNLGTTMLGQPVASPIFVSPTSLGKTVHPEGELEIARACKELGGVAQVVSTSASFSVADVVRAAAEHPGPRPDSFNPPIFLQLYVDKHAPNTEALLSSLTTGGEDGSPLIKGVFLTVDAPVPGKREADERVPPAAGAASASSSSGGTAAATTTPMATQLTPTTDKSGSALGRLMASYISPSLTWDRTIPWLRGLLQSPQQQQPTFTSATPNTSPTSTTTQNPERRRTPLVIKGIQTAPDALRALRAGADAILLSNHGGRSLDGSPATILVLLELQRTCPQIFDRMEVYVDGGVTRGTDVFKALCLGAKGVGVGRGLMYGLGWGREGVRRVLEVLNDELVTTMKMCGVTSLEELHPGLLNTRAVDHLVPDTLSEEHPYAKWRRSKL